MNYLAHAFLSNDDEGLLIGNFIADHIRGNNFDGYNEAIIKGIHLHRQIDTFTDAHPKFKAAKRVFYDGFERYSGVLIDIYFDHLLAKHFDRYSQTPLPEFAEKVYKVYQQHKHLMPGHSGRFLEYVLSNNIYKAYAHIEEIERVLFHLSQRINKGIRLDHSVSHYKKQETLLNTYFQEFFQEAMEKFEKKGVDNQ